MSLLISLAFSCLGFDELEVLSRLRFQIGAFFEELEALIEHKLKSLLLFLRGSLSVTSFPNTV